MYVTIFINNDLLHSQFTPVEFINSTFKVSIFIVSIVFLYCKVASRFLCSPVLFADCNMYHV